MIDIHKTTQDISTKLNKDFNLLLKLFINKFLK